MLPKDGNNTQELKSVPVVDAPHRTKEILVVIAVALGVAALIVYFWDPEYTMADGKY